LTRPPAKTLINDIVALTSVSLNRPLRWARAHVDVVGTAAAASPSAIATVVRDSAVAHDRLLLLLLLLSFLLELAAAADQHWLQRFIVGIDGDLEDLFESFLSRNHSSEDRVFRPKVRTVVNGDEEPAQRVSVNFTALDVTRVRNTNCEPFVSVPLFAEHNKPGSSMSRHPRFSSSYSPP
jgi:hypothetical protein